MEGEYFEESIFNYDIIYINLGLLMSIYSPASMSSNSFSLSLTALSVMTLLKISMVLEAVKNSGISVLGSGAIP